MQTPGLWRGAIKNDLTRRDLPSTLPLTMTADYLFVFAQAHDQYRIPELQSVAELYGINISFPEDVQNIDISRPFMVLGLESEEDARRLARRCILIKSVISYSQIMLFTDRAMSDKVST